MKRIEKLCFLILFSDDAPAALAFALPAVLAFDAPAALALALPAALAADNNVQKTPITKTKTEKVCKRHYIGRVFYEVFAYCLYNDC